MNSSEHLILNANPLVVALQKPAAEFTKADIISYIVKNDIHMVNFMYPGGDGKLKQRARVPSKCMWSFWTTTVRRCFRKSNSAK